MERGNATLSDLAARFPKLGDWVEGGARPTLKQLEAFARKTHTPVGLLLLAEPPVEQVPIPDFRTVRDTGVRRPSADLLDTIYACQLRQEWYRDYLRSYGERELEFVGSVKAGSDIASVADGIRSVLRFDLEARRNAATWEDALRLFVDQAEELGVLVMRNGIVGSDTHRKLDPDEFRGFAISDPIAPLVFINGADSKSAQMFTLAHELVHVWLGQSALSDAGPASMPTREAERWCNAVAAEVLVPLTLFGQVLDRRAELTAETRRLARRFKVSTLVILRRMHDAGALNKEAFWAAYESELERLGDLHRGGGGGDFYNTESTRVSKRFARALIASTLEGQTLYRDAFRMLSVAKLETFREFGQRLGVLS
jgi:Zn-dependent peptidase ImmA (M78 family)